VKPGGSFRVHKSILLDHILGQIKQINIFIPYLLNKGWTIAW